MIGDGTGMVPRILLLMERVRKIEKRIGWLLTGQGNYDDVNVSMY